MSEVTQPLSPTIALPSAGLDSILGRVGQGLRSALTRRHTCRVFAGLTDDQLRDIGVDRATVLGNKPVIAVEAGVMPRLMTMR